MRYILSPAATLVLTLAALVVGLLVRDTAWFSVAVALTFIQTQLRLSTTDAALVRANEKMAHLANKTQNAYAQFVSVREDFDRLRTSQRAGMTMLRVLEHRVDGMDPGKRRAAVDPTSRGPGG